MKPAVCLATLAMIVAACGDNGDGATPDRDTTTTTSTTTTSTTTIPAPAAVRTTVEVATINVLHGWPPPVSGCAESTDHCNAPARVDILWRYLDEQAGCPEIIALQEISPRWFEIVPDRIGELCDGTHVLLTRDVGQIDQEMILTTLPVLAHARTELAGGPVWSAHWAQLDGADGLVIDVFATHYASSAFNPLCDNTRPVTTCGTGCASGMTLGDCHPLETLAFLAERAAPGSLQLVVGDLNARIDDDRILTLTGAGFIDTHLAAGNPECPPEGGANCTSGIGGDTDLDGLDIAEQTPRSRIDFVLARPPDGCELIVDVDDADGDGTHTGLWADTPLPRAVEGLYWAADHTGVQADLGIDCR